MAKVRRTLRRNNMLMDQRKLDAAKAALGASSETAAGGLATIEPLRRTG